MSNVQYGVMRPDGELSPLVDEQLAAIVAAAVGGRVVSRTGTYSLWTDEPSACPRCALPVWPSGHGALHADGQTDCTGDAPANSEVDR